MMIRRIYEDYEMLSKKNILELKQHIRHSRRLFKEFLWFKKKEKEVNKDSEDTDNKKKDNTDNKDSNKKTDKSKIKNMPDAELMHTKLYRQIASILPKTITITNKEFFNPSFGVKQFDIKADLESNVSDEELTVTINIETPKSKKLIKSIFHLSPKVRLSELVLSGTVNNKEITNNNQVIQITSPKEIARTLLKSINKSVALEISSMIRKNKVERYDRRINRRR